MPLKLVKRHGSRCWYIRGTVAGIPVDESTRITDKAQAEALRARREWEIAQGKVYGRSSTATFLEAAVSYMEQGGENRFLGRILRAIGSKRLSEIDQALVDNLARSLYPKAKPGTLNRQLYTPVSAILKHAAARRLCEHWRLERPENKPGRIRWLTPEEAERLIAACAPHLAPLVTFLFYTGARLSEALYLEWREVDLSRHQVSFLHTKNGLPRGVPLHPRLVVSLGNLPRREGAVFRRPDGLPYAEKDDGGGQIKTAFAGACRRAGIKDFRPHDCRHTFATWHYQRNRDLAALMKLGGWASERMVLRYAHVNTKELAPSVNRLPWGKSGDGIILETKKANRTRGGGFAAGCPVPG